jgi:hypothetical protein
MNLEPDWLPNFALESFRRGTTSITSISSSLSKSLSDYSKKKKEKVIAQNKTNNNTKHPPISLYITNAMRSMEDFELSCVIFKIVLLGWKRDVRGFRKSVRDLILIFLQKKSGGM